MIDYEKEFSDFLKQEGCFIAFTNNLIERGESKTIKEHIDSFPDRQYRALITAFSYDSTEEGSVFWHDISRKWKMKYYKLPNVIT